MGGELRSSVRTASRTSDMYSEGRDSEIQKMRDTVTADERTHAHTQREGQDNRGMHHHSHTFG